LRRRKAVSLEDAEGAFVRPFSREREVMITGHSRSQQVIQNHNRSTPDATEASIVGDE
jgi:hypothetical protein